MHGSQHIVFIHGVADISKQWHRSRSFFESHGFTMHFYDYKTLENNLDIPTIVSGLIEFIKEKVGTGDYRILAHSQGGLIAEWFDFFRGDKNLKRIVTIGTPFQGNTLPLIAPKSFMSRLPVGRKQISDLACMSPILSSLIRARIENQLNRTPYTSLITHSSQILKLQSDGIVSVCSGNRNADYFLIENGKIQRLTASKPTVIAYVKSNHLPLSIVRLLQPSRQPNPFSTLLLSALSSEKVFANDHFKPSQCACIFPTRLKGTLQVSNSIQKIISRPTQDGKFIVAYFDGKATKPYVTIDSQRLQLQAGKFTYIIDAEFLNTGT